MTKLTIATNAVKAVEAAKEIIANKELFILDVCQCMDGSELVDRSLMFKHREWFVVEIPDEDLNAARNGDSFTREWIPVERKHALEEIERALKITDNSVERGELPYEMRKQYVGNLHSFEGRVRLSLMLAGWILKDDPNVKDVRVAYSEEKLYDYDTDAVLFDHGIEFNIDVITGRENGRPVVSQEGGTLWYGDKASERWLISKGLEEYTAYRLVKLMSQPVLGFEQYNIKGGFVAGDGSVWLEGEQVAKFDPSAVSFHDSVVEFLNYNQVNWEHIQKDEEPFALGLDEIKPLEEEEVLV